MADVVQKVHILADMDISQAKGQVASLEAAFKKLAMPKNMENNFNKVFSKMKSDLSQVEALMQKGLTSKSDVTSFNKLTDSVSTGYSKIITMVNQLNGQKVTMKVDTAQLDKLKQRLTELQQNYNNALKGITTGTGKDSFGGMLSNIEKIASSSKLAKAGLESIKGSIKAGDFTAADASLEKFVNNLTRLGSAKKNQIAGSLGIEAAEALSKVGTKWSTAQNNQFRDQVLAKLQTELNASAASANTLEAEMNEVAASMNKIQTGNLDKVKTTLQELGSSAEKYAQQQQKMNQQSQQGVMYQYDKQMQVNDLRMQVQYFFGLQNMIRLFRRGVSDAINTVKELDKAMTATAVVTDFSVGDMWGQLPEYTKRAQQLGTTIADMYNATTLYYQQGLDTEHAMGTAVETLKMARIAGIEGAEATDLMTAALRGFRMESNEANASHVNDVYSALAAHSASNTYEIGTAVSKVASLASSANMDLESTATFLAQIIETTREAPETAGTALKTIIARFGEVKKLSKEGISSGVDAEGEAIDINKVDTALKTAGISLQDFINGNEGLDQVFLRLSEKWDTLDIAQQRYIATQAAGSRMQSRFIAMMQDYGRTQELLGIATDSKGAGDQQFAKVADSLETKLNKLKDAYHSFIMGIANSSAIKTGVDILTKGFDLANKAIQKVSGAVKSFNSGLGSVVQTTLSLVTAFAALKIGGKLLNFGVNGLGTLMLGGSAMAAGKATTGGGLFGGIMGAKAAAITQPICSRLDTLIAINKMGNKINAQSKTQDTGRYASGMDFLKARNIVNTGFKNGISINDLQKNVLNEYDAATQSAIMFTSPGTMQAIKKSYISGIENLNLEKEGLLGAKTFVQAQEKAFKGGKISFDSYTKSAAMAANKSFANVMPQVGKDASEYMALGMTNDQALRQAMDDAITRQAESKVTKKYAGVLKNPLTPNSTKETIINEGIKEEKLQISNQIQEQNQKLIQTSKIQNVANSFSTVGASITGAGMALNQFSMQLSSMGADKAAAAISGLGSAFTTAGMAASGIGNIVASIGTKGGQVGLAIGAALAVVLAGIKLYQRHIKKVRDEGKQVTKDYEKNVVKQRKALTELNDGYREYEQLRKGVDKTGHNISLTEDQYQKYQDYTDKLIKMNGSLQQGVNNAGKAYISQSTDIRKALNDEVKEIKKSEDEYLTSANGQKVLDQISTYKRIKKVFNPKGISGKRNDATGLDGYNNPMYNTSGAGGIHGAGEFTKNAAEIKSALESLQLTSSQLKELNLDDINWSNIDAFDAKKIYDAKDAISDYVNTAKEGLFTEDKRNKVSKALKGLSTDYDDAVKASKDMTDWLERYLSSAGKDGAAIEKIFTDRLTAKQLSGKASKGLVTLGKEQASVLVGSFREGLEQIVLQGQFEGWSIDQYTQSANNFSDLLIDLSSTANSQGSVYTNALKNIAKEQENFDKKLLDGKTTLQDATQAYQSNIEKQLGSLEGLAQYYENLEASGVSGAGVIAENIREGMDKAIEYTTNGRDRIAAALNDLSGSFDAANTAIDNYSESTKDLKDFYTAAEGLKGIAEDIGWDSEKNAFTGKDAEGFGSKKFWLGAKELVDEKILSQGSDAVKKHIAEIMPTLKEGEEGFGHFLNFLEKHKDAVSDFMTIDKDGIFDFTSIKDENIGKMADQLGVADTYLAAMINKSRQFMTWQTSDPKEVAAALKSTEGIINGTVTKKNGEKEQAYFANYDNLVAEARGAGLAEHEITKHLEGLEANGIRVTNFDKLESKDAAERNREIGKFKELFASQAKEDHKLTAQDFKNTITKGKFFDEEKLKNAITPLAQSGDYTLEEGIKALQATGLASTNLDDKEAAAISKAWEEATAAPDIKAQNETNGHLANIESYASFIAGSMGQVSQDIINGLDNKEEKIRGGKGYDTKYQKGGILGQDAEGNNLTYEGKKSLLKEIESERAEIQANYDAAERAFETAVTSSDKQKAQEQMDRATSLLNSLDYYESHGLAGIKTAEAVYGEKGGENFNFNNFLKDDWEGLGKLDGILAKIDPEKLDYKTLKNSVNSVELSGMARGSILGQYAWNKLGKSERDLLEEREIDYSELGKAFQANDVDSFLQQIKRGGTGKLFDVNELDVGKEKFGQISALIGQIRDQYAEMQGLNFADADYWKLSEGMGTLDNIDAQAQEIINKYGGTEGFAAHLSFIADDTQALQAIQSIEDESTRIKVLDSIINITSDNGMSPEERAAALKQELTGLLGDSEQAQLIVDAILNTDEAEGKVEELTGKEHKTEVKVGADAQEAENTINSVTSQEYPVTLNPTVGGTPNILTPGATGGASTGGSTTIPVTAEITDTTPPAEEVAVDGTAEVKTATKSGKVKGEPVNVDAKATVKSVKKAGGLKSTSVSATVNTGDSVTKVGQLKSAINGVTSKVVSVTVNTGNSITKVSELKNAISNLSNKSVTVTVVKKSKDETGGGAGGLGKYTPTGWGSLAVGRKRSDTSFKGGPTLTGEEGFEIAWSPKSGKSMILGTTGPQMVDLPKDIVVWTHEESKKILKDNRAKSLNNLSGGTSKRSIRKTSSSALTGELGPEMAWYPKENRAELLGVGGPQFIPNLPKNTLIWNAKQTKDILERRSIPIDSFYSGQVKASDVKGYKGNTSSKKTTTKNSGGKAAAQTAKNTAAIKQGVGRINAMDTHIYNITKRIEVLNARIEKNSEAIKDKLDKTIDFSYSQISGTVGTQSKALTELKKENDALNNAYKTRLKQLETGTNIYEKYQITYQKKTDAKGTEKSDTFPVNLGAFVTKAANGALQVNYKAIDAIAKDPRKGKKMADAILTAVKKEIDDMTSKQISAEKAARDAAKKLQDLREQLKETLFAWENELKKIKILEDKLSLGDSYSKVTEGLRNLIEKTVNPSLSNLTQLADQYQRAINSSIITMKNQISAQLDLRNAYQEQLKSDLTTSDEVANYNKATNAYNNAKKAKKSQGEIEKLYAAMLQARDELDGARVGKRLVSTKMDKYGQIYVDFDWETLESERQKGNVNKTEYEATKKYYEKITNTVEKINDSNNELANKLGSLYEERNDQFQMMSDYTQKIREGMEDEEQKTIDNLKDLNDSIRDAFKDLIDKVKRELNRQRELEKNEKTEQDISDQMNRLAMLRADTAGSNAAEIARLEKEITDVTGDYEDSLEDQLLDRLEDQAEEAADQREKQIELLTAQLEYSQTAGLYLAKAENLVEKIASGKATSEEMKLAQLYYLSSDKLLDKWGKQLEAINFGADTLKVEGFNEAVKAFEAAIGEFNKITETSQGIVQDFINGVLEPSDATQDSYTSRDVKGLKKDITDARKTGLSINDAYKQFVNEGGLSKDLALKALRSSGYTTSEFKAGGYSAKETKSAGFSINDALNAKYSRSQVADAYGKAALGKLDTGKSSLNGIEYAGKKINHKDYVSANGLSTSTISGNAVYQRAYDPVTQKAIGKTKKITFDMFNPTFVRENPQIAGEELNYQLVTHKPGQKLHKNWKALVNASTKIVKPGAEITFNKNNKGTLSSNGGIYYRDNVGIRVWNPADGKVVYHDKYTDAQRAKWIKEAKKGGIGREYARFLKYKGIKYATGGLADYTGPAWMDGTPSKPELVLNPTDTKNFLALRDILSEATKRGVFNHEESAVGGDLNLDIDINVDKIDSDYDVDQIADRVKKIIVKEARSRNVTVTGRLR